MILSEIHVFGLCKHLATCHAIFQVNLAMLENILEEEEDAFVFFYEDNDTDAHTILEELEQVDLITKELISHFKSLHAFRKPIVDLLE